MSDFKQLSKVVALANTDADYKASLLANPKEAMAKAGYTAPDGVTIHFVDEGNEVPSSTNTDIYLQLGKVNSTISMEIDEEILQAAAGGGSCTGTASTFFCIPSCATCASTASSKC